MVLIIGCCKNSALALLRPIIKGVLFHITKSSQNSLVWWWCSHNYSQSGYVVSKLLRILVLFFFGMLSAWFVKSTSMYRKIMWLEWSFQSHLPEVVFWKTFLFKPFNLHFIEANLFHKWRASYLWSTKPWFRTGLMGKQHHISDFLVIQASSTHQTPNSYCQIGLFFLHLHLSPLLLPLPQFFLHLPNPNPLISDVFFHDQCS